MPAQMTPELAAMMKNMNPQMLVKAQKIARMVQMGADLKSVLSTAKREGISPQIVEQFLCAVSPQIKQLKQMMDQSGMTPMQFINSIAQQNNIPQEKIMSTYNDLMSAVQ